MTGADILLKTAVMCGIDLCFANPGTTELPLVLALERQPAIRPVLGLFEGVCTGAADGYGRLLDRPAMVLLHLGPGLANGVANLHNARRAKTPIVNVIGEHTTWHKKADPPLAMDIEGLAATFSGWQRTVTSVEDLSRDMADAVQAARMGQIATLIVPADCQWTECSEGPAPVKRFSYDPVDEDDIRTGAEFLRGCRKPALLLGGRALRDKGLAQAARIKSSLNCDLLTDNLPGYMERGVGLPALHRIPYFPEPALEILSGYDGVLMVGAREPVTFFAYKGIKSSLLNDGQRRLAMGRGNSDLAEVLRCLADELEAPPPSRISSDTPVKASPMNVPTGPLSPETASAVLGAVQPEGAIIVDEGLTTSFSYYGMSKGAPPHSYLTIAGGSIGCGMPCSTGAALACPDRPVITFQADGSAMYTVQALWTQARHGLNVTTLLCSNKSYHILEVELQRVGVAALDERTHSLLSLDGPAINWVKIAKGFGVPASSARTCEEMAMELKKALAEPGPHLIELDIKREGGRE